MSTSTSRPLLAAPRSLALVLVFLAALAIRLYDLTDLPLDFHPTRQLISAIKARGMYYQGLTSVPDWQRRFAVEQWKGRAEIEPEIIERIAASLYRFTGEALWIGRVLSSVFWLAGGAFLYLLLKRIVSPDAAILGTAFYLFLPFAAIASRSFQPDPLMAMLTVAFWWAVYRWSETLQSPAGKPRSAKRKPAGQTARVNDSSPRDTDSWRWAIAAGLLGGLAILIKFSAAFFVIGSGLGAILGRESLKQTIRRPQFWALAVLGFLPGALYLIYGVFVAGFLGQQFSGRFIPALFLSPAYYLNWLSTLTYVLGAAGLALALLGLFFFGERPPRIFSLSLWAAYLAYGLYFNYHIWSHDYYNLPLIPLAAFSLAPLADALAARLTESVAGSRPGRLAALAVLTLGLVAVMMEVRAALKAVDYRPQAAMWAEIGERLGPDARLVALTEDYGLSLAYWGWLDSAAWPRTGDITYHSDLRGARDDFEERFEKLALRRDFFLVTLPEELEGQPLLQERLAGYPVLVQGDGYLIYDLR